MHGSIHNELIDDLIINLRYCQEYEERTRQSIIKILNMLGLETETSLNIIFFNLKDDRYIITIERGWILLEEAYNDFKYWSRSSEQFIDILEELIELKNKI